MALLAGVEEQGCGEGCQKWGGRESWLLSETLSLCPQEPRAANYA